MQLISPDRHSPSGTESGGAHPGTRGGACVPLRAWRAMRPAINPKRFLGSGVALQHFHRFWGQESHCNISIGARCCIATFFPDSPVGGTGRKMGSGKYRKPYAGSGDAPGVASSFLGSGVALQHFHRGQVLHRNIFPGFACRWNGQEDGIGQVSQTLRWER